MRKIQNYTGPLYTNKALIFANFPQWWLIYYLRTNATKSSGFA